eukprot:754452-Hanusia_phi.AAC.24
MGSAISDERETEGTKMSGRLMETMQHRFAVLKKNRQEMIANKVKERLEQDPATWTVETKYKKLREMIDWVADDFPSAAHDADTSEEAAEETAPWIQRAKKEEKKTIQAVDQSTRYVQPLEKQRAQAWLEHEHPSAHLGFDHVLPAPVLVDALIAGSSSPTTSSSPSSAASPPPANPISSSYSPTLLCLPRSTAALWPPHLALAAAAARTTPPPPVSFAAPSCSSDQALLKLAFRATCGAAPSWPLAQHRRTRGAREGGGEDEGRAGKERTMGALLALGDPREEKLCTQRMFSWKALGLAPGVSSLPVCGKRDRGTC